MTLAQMLKEARENVGRALDSAQKISRDMTAKPAEAGTLEESFQKATKDYEDNVKLLRRIEQQERVEKAAEEWAKPAEEFAHRGNPGEGEGEGKGTEGAGATIPAGKIEKLQRAALVTFIRKGVDGVKPMLEQAGMGPKEMHALLGTVGDLGGFLIPPDFRAEIIKDMAGYAIMRGIARVIPTNASVLVLPSIQSATSQANIYSTGYTGAWKPEGYVTGGTAPPTQDQPKFGQESIPVHIWQPNAVELSQELLNDSAAPIDGILADAIAEVRSLDEDAAFFNGDGVGKPLGILQAAGISTVNSGVSASPTYGGLIDLFTALPGQYRQNARWVFNSLTLGKIMKLTDLQNRPIFNVNEIPGNLWTRPITISEFMPDPASASKSIIFGDFRFYAIADRQDLRIQRLVERYAPNIGLLPTARAGGQPLRKAAFKIQVFSA